MNRSASVSVQEIAGVHGTTRLPLAGGGPAAEPVGVAARLQHICQQLQAMQTEMQVLFFASRTKLAPHFCLSPDMEVRPRSLKGAMFLEAIAGAAAQPAGSDAAGSGSVAAG